MLETVFSLTGGLAMVGWLGLAVLPGNRFVVETLARVAIPSIIAVIYIALMVPNFGAAPDGGGFGSLGGVKALFTVDALLLGGWVHYLAFDLFVGSWEVSDARANGIPHWLVLPCLALTLMAGPAGLLLYFVMEIPFVGGGVHFLVHIFGIGVQLMHARELYLNRRGPASP